MSDSSTSYNGWTNYATWRVHLEIFDGCSPCDLFGRNTYKVYELSQLCREYAQEVVGASADNGLALDYALAFLSDVNWHEVAENMLEAYPNEDEDEDEA